MTPSPSPSGRPARDPRRGPAPPWRRVRLLDVLFATVPLLGLGLWLFGSACLDYYRIRQYDDWWSQATSVRKFGWYRLRAALMLPRATTLRERILADDEQRATLRLRVDRMAFNALSSDVGGRWGDWIDAGILSGDREIPAELRFRGDGSAHWTSEKKSLSIKTGKGVLYEGFRRINLSLKDVLPQYLVNSLARDFDLLAPETAVLPVFVNEQYYGIFRFVEDVDESFLRRNLRMPGNIYRADAAERGEYLKGLPREVFVNPAVWERVAANDRPGAPERWGIHLMLDDLLGTTIEDHARLMELLDRGELARLLALLLISGDPYHMSGVHNQLWYDDPVDGTLHPIVWDLRLLDLEHPPRDSNWNRFWQEILRDPRVLDEALTYLNARLADGLLDEARERVETVHGRYRDHFEYDRLREGVIHPVGDPESTLALLAANAEVLRGWIGDARVEALITRLDDGRWLVDLVSAGRAPVLVTHVGPDEIEAAVGRRLWLDPGPEGDEREVGLHSDGSLAEELRLPAAWRAEGALLEPAPQAYRLVVESSAEPVLRCANAITREPLEPGPLAEGPLPDAGGWHPWQLERLETSSGEVTRLSGDVLLERDLVVERGERLVIEPGTALTLTPDVSILVKGELRAEGTAEAPIAVRSSHPGRPFGAFAPQGPGADGSFLSHVSFERGGGALLERVEYKGSVDVYGAREVVFEDCSFARNLRCDDLINVVKGDVDLVRCRFEGANADSIDYDMSTGRIFECEVTGSGNDGLDLMTCSPEILHTRISGSGDKGISIGEAATPRIEHVIIRDCTIGVEVKDLSTPRLFDAFIEGCGTGVLARRKNWRYPGAGRPTLQACALERNEVDLRLLDGASVTWHDGSPGYLLADLPLDEPFAAPDGGWKRMGGARRVVAVDGDLRAAFRDREGAIGRPLGWEPAPYLPHGSSHVVAVTAAGTGVREARVGLTVDGATVEVPLVLDPDPGRFRYTLVPVPQGAKVIQAIALAVDPEQEEARLEVRAVQLLGTHTYPF